MPKRNRIRRFNPRYGVNAAMVAEEARYLALEINGYSVFSASDIAEKFGERYAACERTWKQLQQLLNRFPERERQTIRCLLFRDFYHILELYLCHLRVAHPELAELASTPAVQVAPTDEFSEWLFKP
jgi:hypothetical protein